jgi:hypothetical protein
MDRVQLVPVVCYDDHRSYTSTYPSPCPLISAVRALTALAPFSAPTSGLGTQLTTRHTLLDEPGD